MCGIVGIIEQPGRLADRDALEAMNQRIFHRGPDDGGIFLDREAGIGMRRLSIIDVHGGHQPIANEDRTVWTVFNGEIYNYRELRESLERQGHRFQTHTDTETLVHLYEQYGPEGISRLRGMFAYAIWDVKARRLVLGRDRIGIKPLFYGVFGGRLVFGSELKTLFNDPAFAPELNHEAVRHYLSLLYVPGPDTIFQGVREVPPGHYLVYQQGQATVHRYWDISYRAQPRPNGREWDEEFLSRFRDSVKSHLVSEVPLGAFLSGGIDSSAIVAAMALESTRPVETFSVGHEGEGSFQDERQYARIVAKQYKTNHHELIVTTNVRDLLPKLVTCFDQPFADSSAIPNYSISELTKQYVTVVLSGLGGDEIGAGYERYLGMLLAEHYRRLPNLFRKHVVQQWVERLPDDRAGRPWASRLKRFVATAGLEPPARYAAMQSAFTFPEQERLLGRDFLNNRRAVSPEELMAVAMAPDRSDSLLNAILRADLMYYLPGDLLTLTDRVSMQHSLEVRVPFLDHPLVEFMAGVPADQKTAGWTKKRLLKRAFRSLLPSEILYRKKVGFSVPLALWLRTDLSGVMKDMLSPGEIKRIPYLNYAEVEALMAAHLSGRANHESKLWALMNLVGWHKQFPHVAC